jgi:hypothetical protein
LSSGFEFLAGCLDTNVEIDERILGASPGERTWRISQYVCAFHDGERHLGHVVKTDKWHAYDATHLNLQEDGIRYLGDFSDLDSAKAAVEASVASAHGQKAQGANAQLPGWIF